MDYLCNNLLFNSGRGDLCGVALYKQILVNIMNLELTNEQSTELKELTGATTLIGAVEAAVKFTLLHDKDSVREALKP